MTKKETKEVTTTVSEQTLAQLQALAPSEAREKILLPRISYVTQDKLSEKKVNGKKVYETTAEAGTFFLETPSEEGEKKWMKKEIGKELDVRILYVRKKLYKWLSEEEAYLSSPQYDSPEEVLPLFYHKKQKEGQEKEPGRKVDEGTQKELQAKYPPKEGRKTSSLEDRRVLYVIYEGELYELGLHGTSKWAFLNYVRNHNPAACITHISGVEEKEKGDVNWNPMVFSDRRTVTEEEAQENIATIKKIKEAIAAEKEYYYAKNKEDDITYEYPSEKDEEINPADVPW